MALPSFLPSNSVRERERKRGVMVCVGHLWIYLKESSTWRPYDTTDQQPSGKLIPTLHPPPPLSNINHYNNKIKYLYINNYPSFSFLFFHFNFPYKQKRIQQQHGLGGRFSSGYEPNLPELFLAARKPITHTHIYIYIYIYFIRRRKMKQREILATQFN